MDRLRRSFRDSFRRKIQVPDTYPIDEQAVRLSTCSFPIKYLGCIEVYEKTGADVCEEAMELLKVSTLFQQQYTSVQTRFILLKDFAKTNNN